MIKFFNFYTEKMEVENCNYDGLIFDEACVFLRSEADVIDMWLYSLPSDCVAVSTSVSCKYQQKLNIKFPIKTCIQVFA